MKIWYPNSNRAYRDIKVRSLDITIGSVDFKCYRIGPWITYVKPDEVAKSVINW